MARPTRETELQRGAGTQWANKHSFPAVSPDYGDDLSSAAWFQTGNVTAEQRGHHGK